MERDCDLRNSPPAATVKRITAVLDAFAAAAGGLGVTELSLQLGLAKSVVHRLVTALTETEYLAHNPESRRYSLGPKAVQLGLIAVGQVRIRERVLPHLRELAAETGETATLSLLVADHRVYAEQVESPQPVRQSVQIGARYDLYRGASGKAILAFLTAARRAAILRQADLAPHADGTPVDIQAVTRELELIRQRGYAISMNERVLGAASAAAPVFDHHGDVVGCISVAGVTVRHGDTELVRYGQKALARAAKLSAELGWRGGLPTAAPRTQPARRPRDSGYLSGRVRSVKRPTVSSRSSA